MRIQKSIENKLRNQLEPEFLQVENESSQHNVPPGSESHFKVTIVSDTQSAVANKVVYDVISENIIMTGDVILKEGLSATSGDKLTINLNTGSRRMEGNVRTLILSEEEDT